MPSGVSSSTRLDSAARKCRSWETNSMVPSNSASALISISLVAMSRWLVGSSSTRKFGGSNSIGHHQPRLLAARQHPAFLLDIVAGEAEAARERPQAALAGLREGIFQRLEHGPLAVEQVHRMLREIAHLDAAADRNGAVVGLGRAGDEF